MRALTPLGPGDEAELERFLLAHADSSMFLRGSLQFGLVSLLDARTRGVERAILFTAHDNAPARAAYLALGFRVVGDYGLVAFDT